MVKGQWSHFTVNTAVISIPCSLMLRLFFKIMFWQVVLFADSLTTLWFTSLHAWLEEALMLYKKTMEYNFDLKL